MITETHFSGLHREKRAGVDNSGDGAAVSFVFESVTTSTSLSLPHHLNEQSIKNAR